MDKALHVIRRKLIRTCVPVTCEDYKKKAGAVRAMKFLACMVKEK